MGHAGREGGLLLDLLLMYKTNVRSWVQEAWICDLPG